ncbi:glutamate synthase [Dorcoceras hygrometricum]|uniref:Glutamate synthase n=1 Tax=Dorcoceras hygrometricum TaxID=472368 RepID=A0A2Z7C2T1_9LAMI|nr:glutamate synthase [Dorcoceras hygrometricum]
MAGRSSREVACCWTRRSCTLVAHQADAPCAMVADDARTGCTLDGAVPRTAARETSHDVEEGGAAVQRAVRGPCAARRRTIAHDGVRLRRACRGRMRGLAPCDFDGGAAVGRPPLRRVSGDVVTAGLISSRVWFGHFPGSP